jgi:hypothetical protein
MGVYLSSGDWSIKHNNPKEVRLYQLYEVKKIVDQLGFDKVLDEMDLDKVQNYLREKKLLKLKNK